MIYLDNAATTFKKPREVIEAVVSALESMGNAGRGAHEASLDASRMIYETRAALSELFHVGNPRQVAFTANSTESLNTALNGILQPGDHVITTMLEHNSVLRPLYRLEEQGVELTIVPADERGRLCYSDFERAIKDNTRLIVTTHASNLTGNLVDVGKVGAICRENGLLYVVDASQTAGVFPIDMQAMNIDILCFTGHKSLLGPQGVGGICVREGVSVRPLKVGGSGIKTYDKKHPEEMPTALEAGTINGHGLAGLHAALLYLKKTGIDSIRGKEQKLMRSFYEGVKDIPGVKVYGDFETTERAPVVALNIGDYDSSEVSDELSVSYGISTRPGAHCAPLMHEALGTVSQGAVRFSFSHYNTGEEINAAIEAVRELAGGEA